MFNIGDIFRKVACVIDETYVNFTGRSITYYECKFSANSIDALYKEDVNKSWSDNPISLRAFYEIPRYKESGYFGIDSCDEMNIVLGFDSTLKVIKKIPAICDIFVDCTGGKWIV